MPKQRTINLPELHSAQVEVALDRHRFKVVAAGRRFGKGVLGISESFRRGIKGAKCRWITPSYASDSYQAGWTLATTLARQLPGTTVHLQRRQIDFAGLGGAWLQFRTAEEPDGLRGEGIDFCVFDEAAHVSDLETMWEQCVRPSLLDRSGHAWFISTPYGFNYFYELYLRARDDQAWASFQYPTTRNSRIAVDEVAALRRALPELIARQEIDAEFVQLAGALFRRENIAVLDARPACARWVRSWDLAFTEKTTSDWSVGALMGLDNDGRILVADVVRLRAEWPAVVRTIAATARLDGPDVQQGIESVGAQVGALQTLLRDPMLAGYAFRPIEVTKDKLTRALPLVARSEQGKFAVVRGAWTQTFIDELAAFPEGSHDDQVDAVSGGLQLLSSTGYYAVVI
jgi:predicted phage terminase large subunit-like protein